MPQFRTFTAALAAALACAWNASAQDGATTVGAAEIHERGGIEATGQVIFEDLIIAPTISLAPVVTTASTHAANLSVLGDESVVSIAVPQTFDVLPTGGGEGLTVVTALDGDEAGVFGFGSLVSAGEALSVDIGGAISIRPEDLAPGEYRGLLVVVAQYN